jgi:hypothetical protein
MISPFGLYRFSYSIKVIKSGKYYISKSVLRYLIPAHQISNTLVFKLYQLLCILFLRKIYDACGGNKCHWCIVAIVKAEKLELNRYRGIPHKRSVESSCIGRLSCMLGKPSLRYRHTSTGSAWGEVQNL